MIIKNTKWFPRISIIFEFVGIWVNYAIWTLTNHYHINGLISAIPLTIIDLFIVYIGCIMLSYNWYRYNKETWSDKSTFRDQLKQDKLWF